MPKLICTFAMVESTVSLYLVITKMSSAKKITVQVKESENLKTTQTHRESFLEKDCQQHLKTKKNYLTRKTNGCKVTANTPSGLIQAKVLWVLIFPN